MERSWMHSTFGSFYPVSEKSKYAGSSDNCRLVSLICLQSHQTNLLSSGCGPLGLLVIAVAKAYGVAKIIAFDIEQSRVDFAVKHGADIGVLSSMNTNSEEPLTFATTFINKIIKRENLGSGVDLAIEASGAEACVHMGVVITKPGGTCKVSLSESPSFLLTESRHPSRSWQTTCICSIV